MKTLIAFILSLIIFLYFSLNVRAQDPRDFGDAPEGVIAYPSLGVSGSFPTCKNVGPVGWVEHKNFGAVLGGFDFETEGNAALCPFFTPYDSDECFADGDAGLVMPESYTIVNGQVVACPGVVGTPLGQICQTISWGTHIDILVENKMPGTTMGYMNVVIDWNQNGQWGDVVNCSGTQIPEHVLQNFPVPIGTSGLLSLLGPSGFTIGPNTGYVWARFTISEIMVAINWDGGGVFEDGESEDYLLEIVLNTDVNKQYEEKTKVNLKVQPNPACGTTKLSYYLPFPAKTEVYIYNLQGALVHSLVNAFQPKGEHEVIWNGVNTKNVTVPEGMYFIELRVNKSIIERTRLIWMK